MARFPPCCVVFSRSFLGMSTDSVKIPLSSPWLCSGFAALWGMSTTTVKRGGMALHLSNCNLVRLFAHVHLISSRDSLNTQLYIWCTHGIHHTPQINYSQSHTEASTVKSLFSSWRPYTKAYRVMCLCALVASCGWYHVVMLPQRTEDTLNAGQEKK